MSVILRGILRFPYQITIAGLCIALFFTGCSKNKYSCEAYGTKKHHKIQKNRSRYNVLYSTKTKPVPKNYLIKNGR